MTRDWYMRASYGALGAALVLAATAAIADPLASQTPVPKTSLMVAQNTTSMAPGSTMERNYPPLQAGVRQAAAQGPEALRRYIWRTRQIFNYYYPDWVKFIPS
jgi:hypothetical protein